MNRQLLEAPFTPGQIKQRKGNFGRDLMYLEGHAVIQRLNDALDADWSFEIAEHHILQDEVLVKVERQLPSASSIYPRAQSAGIRSLKK